MNRQKRLTLSTTVAALLALTTPREAFASTYICQATYMSDQTYGYYGHLYFTFYDQPYCEGNYITYKVWCSTNATPQLGYCTSDTDNLATTYSVLLEAWKIAIEAMRNGEEVDYISAGNAGIKGLTIYGF